MTAAVLTWIHARPWRAGWLLCGAALCALVAPLVGGIAWVCIAPVAMFVVGYDLWWYLHDRPTALVLCAATTSAAAVSAALVVGFAGVTAVLYTVGSIATALALLAGYRWGRHRSEQERSAAERK